MSQDYKDTLLRSSVGMLILIIELLLLPLLPIQSPAYVPEFSTLLTWYSLVLIGATWWLLSKLYSQFTPGGYRVRIAAWVGICWPLPITLALARFHPAVELYSATGPIFNHLTLPVLCILPTLLFCKTEPYPQPPVLAPLHKGRHLLYIATAIFAILFTLHNIYTTNTLPEPVSGNKIQIRAEYAYETEDYHVIVVYLTNRTQHTILIGDTPQSIAGAGLDSTAGYNSVFDTRDNSPHAPRCGFPKLYTMALQPQETEHTRMLYRKTAPHQTPNSIALSFTYLQVDNKVYTHQVFTLKGDIDK